MIIIMVALDGNQNNRASKECFEII